jgi:heterotetrameric sarcosine oxidase gamma subunit
MSLEFLCVDATATTGEWSPIARSPMERPAQAAGARFEARHGWNVAIDYGDQPSELEAMRSSIGFVDLSHLSKIELQASPEDLRPILAERAGGVEPELGHAARTLGAWWAPLTAERALLICDPSLGGELRTRLERAAAAAQRPASVLDVSTAFGALALVGPMARETFARFSAIDLRPPMTPIGGLRPGSIARTPGLVIREAEDRYLILFGAALAEYVWTVVADAAESLGGSPIGVDALDPIDDAVVVGAGEHA